MSIDDGGVNGEYDTIDELAEYIVDSPYKNHHLVAYLTEAIEVEMDKQSKLTDKHIESFYENLRDAFNERIVRGEW